jgi:hypothetical protein
VDPPAPEFEHVWQFRASLQRDDDSASEQHVPAARTLPPGTGGNVTYATPSTGEATPVAIPLPTSRHSLASMASMASMASITSADRAIRVRIAGCSRVSSWSTGFGGGPIAPSGAPNATGCMYMKDRA